MAVGLAISSRAGRDGEADTKRQKDPYIAELVAKLAPFASIKL